MNDTIYLYDDNIGRVQLIEHWGNDKTVTNAARVSFGQDNEKPLSKRDKTLIKYLIEHRHTSVLEHCGATFKFVVPLFIRSQHHRHRTWSYNEISRRYTSVDLRFYEPKMFRMQHESNRQASTDELADPKIDWWVARQPSPVLSSICVKDHHVKSLQLYNHLLEAGVCREQARGVLPQSLYTEYYGTVNVNNLLKFIDLRLHEGAQWEIVQVAKALQTMGTELWPATFGAYSEIKKAKQG